MSRGSLDDVIAREPSWTSEPANITGALLDACDGLNHLHENSVVHRDCKQQ
jgi:serine/threonine protein kinase